MTSLIGEKRGFTLIEIMVTLAVLSLGIVAVYQSLFVLLDVLAYSSDRLKAQYLVGNKICEREYNIEGASETQKSTLGRGLFARQKGLKWQIDYLAVDDREDLGELTVSLSWRDRGRLTSLTRTTYLEE